MISVLMVVTLIANILAIYKWKSTNNRVFKILLRIVPFILTLVLILYAVFEKGLDNIEYLFLCMIECINLVGILLMIEPPKISKGLAEKIINAIEQENKTDKER
ncbi:hypothetical protein [Ruminococcus sp.]|uniref:hypothetical protein n=1 Tax=Ruminococcus sp. TaxID=41978 RepID=UPI0026003A26|nr:hypothetical protein [Ruminococcus sp.]